MTDESEQMRSEKDFIRVRNIVGDRLVKMSFLKDPEFMMELTTIMEALNIAAMVARGFEGRNNK